MRSRIFVLGACLILALLVFSACQPPAVDVEAETFAVKTAMENYFVADKEKSIDKLATLVDQNIAVISPFTGEDFIGWEAVKAHVEKYFSDETFTVTNYAIKDPVIKISALGDAAWFHASVDESYTYQGKSFNYSDIKWTGALQKYEGNWIFTQVQFAFLRANEAKLAGYRTVIEAQNAKIAEAVATGNVDAIVAYYEDNAILMPPNSEMLTGIDMVKTDWQNAFGQGLKSGTFTVINVIDGGEYVCEIGKYQMTIQPRGRRATTENGKYMTAWLPQPDGSLKIAFDMWNSSPAPK
jgi:ketosteroid isomerase-like protein